MNLAKLLAIAGYTPQSAAQELARAGYGDAAALQRALETGDRQALAFIPEAARNAQQTPGLADRAMAIMKNFPASAGRN